jgi:hypothetical protein
MPFGKYSICLRDPVAGRGWNWTAGTPAGEYDNTAKDGKVTATTKIDPGSSTTSWTSGTCNLTATSP